MDTLNGGDGMGICRCNIQLFQYVMVCSTRSKRSDQAYVPFLWGSPVTIVMRCFHVSVFSLSILLNLMIKGWYLWMLARQNSSTSSLIR